MALTITQLQAWHDALVQSRMQGARSVRDQSGEAVEFRSDAEMQRAISAAERQIAALTRTPPTTIRFRTSKGL